jgi:hypothetical protein
MAISSTAEENSRANSRVADRSMQAGTWMSLKPLLEDSQGTPWPDAGPSIVGVEQNTLV